MSDASVNQSIQQQFGAVAANYTTSTVHASGADLQGLLAAAGLLVLTPLISILYTNASRITTTIGKQTAGKRA